MTKLSRRTIASYAADQLLAAKPTSQLAKAIYALLAESGRLAEVDLLFDDIAWLLETRRALMSAKVTTAKPLSRDLEIEIKRLLKSATDTKEISIEKTVDSSVIGGLRIDSATKVWDYTVARQLATLKETV